MAASINKLDTAGEWMWNNSHLYIPSAGVKIQHTNVAGADSGRTEDGVMHIDWVRRDVRKVFLTYQIMTEAELSYMIGLLQGQEGTFKFYDKGAQQTMDAYVGESVYSYESSNYLGKYGRVYTGVSINIIEM